MAKLASDIHKEDFLVIDGNVCRVIEVDKKSGGGQFGSIVHAKYMDLKTGHVHDKRFNPSEKVEEADVQLIEAVFSYNDQDTYYFMDEKTYEQFEINERVLSNYAKFIKENDKVELVLHNGEAIAVNIPEKVKVKVVQTGEVTSGTDKSVWKPAIIEGNIEIMVPGFIKTGDTIVISTEKLEYIGRE